MDKLGRTYLLSIQIDSNEDLNSDLGSTLTIKLPTTIEFDISRNFLGGSANTGTFRIYNLGPDSRNDIRFDIDNFGETRKVTLLAGYKKNINLIYTGTISRASSIREGVNFITTIDAHDDNFIYTNAFFSGSIPANTPMAEHFKTIIDNFPKDNAGNVLVSAGVIGDFPQTNPRPAVYNKPSIELLKELSDNKFFIDNGKAHVLNNNEYISTGLPPLFISPQTGLLDTPQLEESNLTLNMVFEPRLTVGTLVQIQSVTDPKYNNRIWTVKSVKHRGMISGAVCGEVISTIQVAYSPIQLTAANPFGDVG